MSSCLLCGLSVALLQVWPPPGLAEKGFLSRVCITVQVNGSGARLASWVSPAISTRTGHIRYPGFQSSSVCGFAPWAPHLPTNATWEVER